MQGENAQKHPGREYWSRRLPGAWSWGRVGKWMTHRRERAETRRLEVKARQEAEEAREWYCESCDTMTEPGERYCRHCKSYWDDVAKGVFKYE